MKYNFIYLLITLVLVLACGQSNQTKETPLWNIQDVTQSAEQISMLPEGNPTSIQLRLVGEVDNTFSLRLAGSSNNMGAFIFKAGPLDTIVSQAWGSPTCKVTYYPSKVTSGNLGIEVKLIQ